MLAVLAALEAENKSIADFLDEITTNSQYNNHPALNDLCSKAKRICISLDRALQCPETLETEDSAVRVWATQMVLESFQQELQELMKKSSKWRFSAMHSKAEQIKEFKIEDMARTMMEDAPRLWNTLGGLLQANESNLEENWTEDGGVNEYWEKVDEMDLEGIIDHITNDPVTRQSRRIARRRALISVVCCKIFSWLVMN